MNFAELVTKKEIRLDGRLERRGGRWEREIRLNGLGIGRERLRDDDVDALVRVLQESEVLVELHLEYIDLRDHRITLASPARKEIRANYFEEITNALAKNRTLKRLSLTRNEVGDEGAAKSLAAALKVNKTLEELDYTGYQDPALLPGYSDVKFGTIVVEGAKIFAAALKVNNTLQRINLDCHRIGDEGAKCLADAILHNQSLRNMSLCENGIGNEGGRALANAQARNHNSIEILVRGNRIDGVTCLRKDMDDSDLNWGDESYLAFCIMQQIATKDVEVIKLEEENARLREVIARKDGELGKRDKDISSKNEEIASLKETLNNQEVVRVKQEENTNEDDAPGKVFTRSKRLFTGVVKQEDIVNGNVKCPDPGCPNIIPFAEGGCNIMVCTNHSPRFLYFCIHCKEVNDNGMEYATCSCSRRNTKETRTEAQKIRNEMSRKNPIVL